MANRNIKITRRRRRKCKKIIRLCTITAIAIRVLFFAPKVMANKYTSYGLKRKLYISMTQQQKDFVISSLENQPEQVQKAVMFCLDHLGDEYSQPLRFTDGYSDCSSLVYRAYLAGGIDISNNDMTYARAIYQGLENKAVDIQSPKQLQSGDIVFYADDETDRYKGIYHVALYVGDGMMCDATTSVGCVAFRPLRLYDRWYVVRLDY